GGEDARAEERVARLQKGDGSRGDAEERRKQLLGIIPEGHSNIPRGGCMFDDVLIESAGKDKKKGGWKTVLISAMLHLVIIGWIVAAGLYVKKNPEIITKPIPAFVVLRPQAPPPPPPQPATSLHSPPPIIPRAHHP